MFENVLEGTPVRIVETLPNGEVSRSLWEFDSEQDGLLTVVWSGGERAGAGAKPAIRVYNMHSQSFEHVELLWGVDEWNGIGTPLRGQATRPHMHAVRA